jgi:predicted RNA-binding Zn-ribbon protein involved in translation (DUF1610 family)
VEVSNDDPRARVRCPHCGVMCDLPARTKGKTEDGRRKTEEKRNRRDQPGGSPGNNQDAIIDEALLRPEPALPSPPARPVSAPLPPPVYPFEHSNEDDGKPYFVPSLMEERPCPNCGRTISADAVVCTSCGYNLQTRKKAVEVYEPIQRSWQEGWSMSLRRRLFLGVQAVVLPVVLLGAVLKKDLFGWFFPWLVLTAMLVFLLGTCGRLDLSRNRKGRVRLTRTLYACFLPRPPKTVNIHEYGGVILGQFNEAGFMEWFILIALFLYGIWPLVFQVFEMLSGGGGVISLPALMAVLIPGLIPPVIWWYVAIHRVTYQVTLTQEYETPALQIFQSSNPEVALDIVETIRNIARMPPTGSGPGFSVERPD